MEKPTRSVKFDWFMIGAELVNLSDEEQCRFFAGFANELGSWTEHVAREAQMLFVRDKLESKQRDTLREYLPCLWFGDDGS